MAMSKMAERSTYQAGDAVTNAATGYLSDPVTEKTVAYVSKEGSFVVQSRIAAELFEQPDDSEASTPSLATEGQHAEEYVTGSNRPPSVG